MCREVKRVTNRMMAADVLNDVRVSVPSHLLGVKFGFPVE